MFKLIECVEGFPILWNAKDNQYRNKVERQSAWKEMETNVFDGKFSASEIMAKWSNMRIQYRSYDAKIRKTKSGQGAVEQVKWKFFKAMDFVGRAEASQTVTTVSNLLVSDANGDGNEIIGRIDSPVSPPLVKHRRLSTHSCVTNRSGSSSAADIVAKGMKDAVHELKNRQTQREDEFDTFGKYIATELRSMSDASAVQRVRFKLARSLMDAIEFENNRQFIVVDENLVVSQIVNTQDGQAFITEQQEQ